MLQVRVNHTNLNQDVRRRTASRALVIKDNKVAILYSKKYNFYLTPGGGVEWTIKGGVVFDCKELLEEVAEYVESQGPK